MPISVSYTNHRDLEDILILFKLILDRVVHIIYTL